MQTEDFIFQTKGWDLFDYFHANTSYFFLIHFEHIFTIKNSLVWSGKFAFLFKNDLRDGHCTVFWSKLDINPENNTVI